MKIKLIPLHIKAFCAAILILFGLLVSCQEKLDDSKDYYDTNPKIVREDTDSTIYVSDSIIIADKGKVRDTLFSYSVYEKFLKNLLQTGRFMFVPVNELATTNSTDKVLISLRHDIDYDIASSVRFARREHKLGIRGTYYFLHTADYYSETIPGYSERKPSVLDYMKKIQNCYNHEIGWHNDLVTLQVVYRIDAEQYLFNELEWLKANNIKIDGTCNHGSPFCYKYFYLNCYFWKSFGSVFPFKNFESVFIGNQNIKINKYDLSHFGLKYDADLLRIHRMLADVHLINENRWHMKLIDWNSFKPGDKIIIIFHPALWDSF
jgi:hypothetical protein